MNEPSRTEGRVVSERRASVEQLLALGAEAEPVARIEKRWVSGAAGELRVWVYTPTGAPVGLLPGLIYFHGGRFVAGSLEAHDGICRSLANASACRVAAVDYRLGPEATFQAALLDACAATRGIAAQGARFGIDFRAIGVAGDCAGATLAAAVAQTLAAEGAPPLALQCLLCPLLDTGAGSSPLKTERLQGLPPACIHTAESDPLREQGAAYAAQLERAGVRVIYRCHAPAAAVFPLLGKDLRALL